MSLIGQSIGNYQIKAKIGEGGMGSVYLGEHPLIGKRVAIKVLLEELSAKEDIVTRFFHEAKAVNDIGHQNIVDIVDFGKLTGQGGASQKTRTGLVIGTPAYMSPEQCEGKGLIDHRSDVYSLGVVMYELLTGQVPFPGEGFGEILVAHLMKMPEPPSRQN